MLYIFLCKVCFHHIFFSVVRGYINKLDLDK